MALQFQPGAYLGAEELALQRQKNQQDQGQNFGNTLMDIGTRLQQQNQFDRQQAIRDAEEVRAKQGAEQGQILEKQKQWDLMRQHASPGSVPESSFPGMDQFMASNSLTQSNPNPSTLQPPNQMSQMQGNPMQPYSPGMNAPGDSAQPLFSGSQPQGSSVLDELRNHPVHGPALQQAMTPFQQQQQITTQKGQLGLEEQQADIGLKQAQANFYGRRPGETPGTFTMGGVNESGAPVFYNNKTLEPRVAPIPGGGMLYPKSPSESQGNAALFGQRAIEANQQLEKLLSEGFDPTSLKSGAAGFLPSAAQPANVQAFQQARRNFTNSVLRKESGAAISDSEHSEANKQYFPVIGDSPEVLKLKAQNRVTAIQALGKIAGPMGNQNTQKDSVTTHQIGRFKVTVK